MNKLPLCDFQQNTVNNVCESRCKNICDHNKIPQGTHAVSKPTLQMSFVFLERKKKIKISTGSKIRGKKNTNLG